jgi:ABC-type multidrug transport system ATPase subunit
VWELINGLRAEGMAVVLTTHYMDEAERLSDRLVVLQLGKVRAMGRAHAVLGDVVGEHVVLLSAQAPEARQVIEWLRGRGVKPAQILADWHMPLDAPGLAAFVAAFPELRYEVRPPTLDDLFLALASEEKR